MFPSIAISAFAGTPGMPPRGIEANRGPSGRSGAGASMNEIAALLGKEEVLKRLAKIIS